MYKLLLITILTTLIIAQDVISVANPKPYSSLGDVLYDNYEKIGQMTNVDAFKTYSKEINDYISDILTTKEMGYALELRQTGVLRKDYLDTLRELSKKNDDFLRKIENGYRTSIEKENSKVFLQIVNSELVDVEKNKKEIIGYYYLHSDDINSSGVIDRLIKENDAIRKLQQAQKKRYKTKKMREEERIKSIRLVDKQAKEKLEQRLQQELDQKKVDIRDNQVRELAN